MQRSRFKAVRLLAALAVFVLTITACASQTTDAGGLGEDEDIVLGMFAPLTGPLASTGVPARDGVQTWVDETNAAGGINGRQVRLVAYDDANNPEQAVANARRLIDRDEVFALICGSSSGSTQAALPVVTEAGVPFLTCISAFRGLLDPFNENVYRMYANEIAQAEAVADYVAENLQAERPAIIYNSNDFGVGGFEAMTARLEEQGHPGFVAAERYNVGDQDFSSQLLNVRDADPDVLVVHSFAAGAGVIVRQAQELGIDVPMVGGGGTPTPLFPEAAGESAEGFTAVWVFPVLPDPDDFEPVARYTDLLSEYVYPDELPVGRPSLYDMTGYCAGTIMGEALRQAGDELTRERLREVLNNMESFEPGGGMCYPVSFSAEDHEGTSETSLVRVNADLEFEPFTPEQ